MTIITINEIKTKDEIILYLKEENLIPKDVNDISVISTYFETLELGKHELKIIVKFDEENSKELNYIINYVNNEKVNINNNNGVMFLTSFILLSIVLIFTIIKVVKKLIIKRKNNKKDSLEL